MSRKYSHVIVIGVDGAGAWFNKAETSCFDRIFSKGAVTYKALSSKPTISAECWGSMLIGVGPEVHKLTNKRVSILPYPIWSAHPTVFRRIRKAYPDAELGSYCDWNPITKGIVEHFIGVSHHTARDKELTPIICDYISKKKPDFLFIHFDSTDGAGHKNGYGTQEHLKAITEVDKLIGDVYSSIEQSGFLQDTLFMVISDHGGTCENGKGSHGGWTDEEKYVTFAAVGRGVNNCEIDNMNIRDLAAIVLYALGIKAPDFDINGWTSQVPMGIFNDDSLPEYKDISGLPGAASRISKKHHTSELV